MICDIILLFFLIGSKVFFYQLIGTASIGTTHWLPTQYVPGFNWYDSEWKRTKKIVKAAVANHDIAAVRQAL